MRLTRGVINIVATHLSRRVIPSFEENRLDKCSFSFIILITSSLYSRFHFERNHSPSRHRRLIFAGASRDTRTRERAYI